MSGLIDRAEARGLVARTTGHPDGRAVRVRLTEQGAKLAARFADEVYAELRTVLAPLSDRDQRQLFQLADAILAASDVVPWLGTDALARPLERVRLPVSDGQHRTPEGDSA